MAKKKTPVTVGRRKLELSNLDKVMYPVTGLTKGDVIDYYRAVSKVVLPYLKNRPLTLKRYPDGVEHGFFYEKRCPRHAPDWIKTVDIRRRKDDTDVPFCVIDTEAALTWATNLANLELHTGLARGTSIQRPSWLVFDLDPGEPADISDCARVAVIIRDLLAELDLDSYAKTSGSKGMQLYVPLNSGVTYERTRPFAHGLALHLEKEHPDLIVSSMKKEIRGGKVLIDWSQNSDFKTTVAVYSLRAKERPTVSTPVSWKEVEAGAKGRSLSFEASDVLKRIEREGDLFEPVLKTKQRLPKFPEA